MKYGKLRLGESRSSWIHLNQARLTFLNLELLGGYQLTKSPFIFWWNSVYLKEAVYQLMNVIGFPCRPAERE